MLDPSIDLIFFQPDFASAATLQSGNMRLMSAAMEIEYKPSFLCQDDCSK
jgi:hypothetical protein